MQLHGWSSKFKIKINYTQKKKTRKKTKKKQDVQQEHYHQVCKLSNFAMLLSNMYFLNFSWKL